MFKNNSLYIRYALRTYLNTNHLNMSAIRLKFGFLKLSIEINLLYPIARIISVKSGNRENVSDWIL